MALQVKKFSWVRSATGWEQFQSWQERRKALRSDFDAQRATAYSGFSTAWSNQISGQGNLAAQAALDRINAATKAKLDTTA